jgi:hypothetical protein
MTELQQTEVLAWWDRQRQEIIAERIYLKHYARNRENNQGLTESQVAVNAMMDFYEQMKNKDNGNQTSTIR